MCVLFLLSMLCGFTSTYDTATPQGSDDPAEADDRMREIKAAVQERENVDHYWPLTGTEVSDADTGEHRKVTLRVGSAPTKADDKGILYSKDVNSKAELFYIDEDGNEVQLTSAGALNLNGVLPGTISQYGGSSAPSGYLLCDGTEVSQTTYAAIYAVLGADAFGTDAGGNFFLPDMRGRVPLGVGTGDASDATAHALADKEGTETHVLTDAEMPSHNHSVPNTAATGVGEYCENGGSGASENINTGTEGSDDAHNNLQPSLTLNFIIKT